MNSLGRGELPSIRVESSNEKKSPANVSDLGGELLKSVSRSFYLTLRALPKKLREPISLAYLLARASDTIADSASVSAQIKAQHLRAFAQMIESGADDAQLAILRAEITSTNRAEQNLIAQIDRCLAWLLKQRDDDRADIIELLKTITHGQALDVLRFQNPREIVALKNADELEEYTFLVAGCVGDFWTRLCFRHVKNFSRENESVMRERGIHFGKGLQLVNILRDLPADLREGRCYLPSDELTAAGCAPEKPCAQVFNRWLSRANELLEDGFRYIESTQNFRLRFACILPWHIGIKTLALLREKSPLETATRIKVPRAEIRRALFVQAPLAAFSNAFLRKLRG